MVSTLFAMYTCNRCGFEKPATEFHKKKSLKRGFRSRCKACLNALQRKRGDGRHKYDNGMFECSACHVEKPGCAFYKDKTNVRGHSVTCKKCKNKYKNKYVAQREIRDPEFRMQRRLRASLCRFVRREVRDVKLMRWLGCDWSTFRSHLQAMFKDGMTFENYGNWQVDHICPIYAFTQRELRYCWFYKNLRPMWKRKNLEKSYEISVSMDVIKERYSECL